MIGWTSGLMDGCFDGCVLGWKWLFDEWVNVLIDEWMDG